MNLYPTIKTKYNGLDGQILYVKEKLDFGKGLLGLIFAALNVAGIAALMIIFPEAPGGAVALASVLLIVALLSLLFTFFKCVESNWYVYTKRYTHQKKVPGFFEKKYINEPEYQTILQEYMFKNVDLGDKMRDLNELLYERAELARRMSIGDSSVVDGVLMGLREENDAFKKAVEDMREIQRKIK